MFKKKRKPMATRPWRGARPVRNTAKVLDILNAIAVFTMLAFFMAVVIYYYFSQPYMP